MHLSTQELSFLFFSASPLPPSLSHEQLCLKFLP